MKLTEEEKLAKVKELRPIDDVFFSVLAQNKEVCQEILRTILGDKELVVTEVITQDSKRNFYGRSVILDALCTLGDGRKCNIEVQRSDNDDHLKRVRFNASSITVKDSQTGEDFSKIVDLCVIYISEFDVFGDGLTTYHIDKVVRENGRFVDDGLREIFVNTAIDDGSDIADLMRCFLQKSVNNPKFPKLSKAVSNLKETEGGREVVCKAVQDVYDRGIERGMKEERLKAIRTMSANDFSDADIEKAGYTKEEIEEAKADIVPNEE